MSRLRYRGQLTKWNDEKGYGFITPNDTTRTVFLHIRALSGMPRRPVVGDIITYEIAEDTHGKTRAVHAAIEGVSRHDHHHPYHTQAHPSGSGIASGVAALLLLLVVGSLFVFIQSYSPSTSPPLLVAIQKPGCTIKGNISISTGTPYYHLPGMEDYDSTVIDPSHGEQWFCTEDEALAHGWKKAPR